MKSQDTNISSKYYIIKNRFTIVFMFDKSQTYLYWDVEGVENHRITVSAKGPFNNTLSVSENKQWRDEEVERSYFIDRCRYTEDEINDMWIKYFNIWKDTLNNLDPKNMTL